MQLADVNCGKTEVQFFAKKMNFYFSKTDFDRLHKAPCCHSLTAGTALQCMEADRAHAACSRTMS